jgi:hypothetical protein
MCYQPPGTGICVTFGHLWWGDASLFIWKQQLDSSVSLLLSTSVSLKTCISLLLVIWKQQLFHLDWFSRYVTGEWITCNYIYKMCASWCVVTVVSQMSWNHCQVKFRIRLSSPAWIAGCSIHVHMHLSNIGCIAEYKTNYSLYLRAFIRGLLFNSINWMEALSEQIEIMWKADEQGKSSTSDSQGLHVRCEVLVAFCAVCCAVTVVSTTADVVQKSGSAWITIHQKGYRRFCKHEWYQDRDIATNTRPF